MSKNTFYAWAIPAFVSGSPVDHTWVTTYDNRITQHKNVRAVVKAKVNYWYCWGDFHSIGGTPVILDGFLGSQVGDQTKAQCLCSANADSRLDATAQGTIFSYGIDGVCHQLANQVLYATGLSSGMPLTVSNARGYHASTFLYGTYGLQHLVWNNKVNSCAVPPIAPIKSMVGVTAMSKIPDEFEQHLRKSLGTGNEDIIAKLLALRNEGHAQRADVMLLQNRKPVTAETINERNQQILDKAKELLGDELFTKVFGYSPDNKINLVDPAIVSKMNPNN